MNEHKSGKGNNLRTVLKCGGMLFSLIVLFCFLRGFGIFSLPRSSAESLHSHLTVWCDDPQVSEPLPVALVYSHEGGVFADGALHFLPLKDFLQWEYTAPVITVKDSPLYHVEYDTGFFDLFEDSVSFYEPTVESFVRIKKENGENVTLEDLQPGEYIMAINIHVEKGKEYFSGASFIHIIIPGGTGSVWPIPTETPPVLTPLPTVYLH